MSFLSGQIEKLKQKQGNFGAQKWVKKGDVESQREKEYLEEQKKKEETRKQLQQIKLQELYEFYSQDLAEVKKGEKETGKEEQKQMEIDIPFSKEEIINRLREFGREATLFGESDQERYRRMLAMEEIFEEDYRKGEKEDTSKSFLPQEKDLQKIKFLKSQAEEKKGDQKEQKEELKEEEDGGTVLQGASSCVDSMIGRYANEDELRIGDRNMDELVEVKEKNHQLFRNVRKFENQCKRHPLEEKCKMINLWCQKMLKAWEQEVFTKEENFLKTADGKIEIGMQRQCLRYIRPLLKLLRKNSVSSEILDGLYLIVQYCLMKEYVRSHDKYLELAIGNAPWPMGVTMVGIHERSGRSRIFSSQVAHILNDETQRKYLQSIKRLLTVCQRLFPTDPSKTVKN